MSERYWDDGYDSRKKFVIDENVLPKIQEIALQIFHGRVGSTYSPISRDEILINALKLYLEQQGVICEWELDDEFT
jgi:hypothetical protein